jgi:type IV pilus assembly protein PilC
MQYFYEAVDAAGQTQVGKIDALNEQDARTRLLRQGYNPLALAQAGGAPVGAQSVAAMPVRPLAAGQVVTSAPVRTTTPPLTTNGLTGMQQSRAQSTSTAMPKPVTTTLQRPSQVNNGHASTREVMFYFTQLATLIRSGMNVYTAVHNLAGRIKNPTLAAASREMATQSRSGSPMSDVMLRYPRVFPDHVVGTVRAGEVGGFLDIALDEIAHNYEQNVALYRNAWIPKAMALQAAFIPAVLQPFFPNIIPDANTLRYVELVLFRNIPITLAVLGALWLGSMLLQSPKHRRFRDEISLRIRPFGELQRKVALATFIRMLRRLYNAGVAPVSAWEAAMYSATNLAIRDRLVAAYSLMQRGSSLPQAFAATGLFTDSVEQLIATGFESGEVVESLDRIAAYYQEQVAEAISKSKFTMLRAGILAMILLTGGAFCYAAYMYRNVLMGFMDLS